MDFCPPHEHFANGFAEKCVQLDDRGTRTVMHGAAPLYPKARWPAAARFKAYTLNCTTESSKGSSISSWEAFMGNKPDFKAVLFLPFGREAEGLHNRADLNKPDSRTFAGFSEGPAPFHMHAINTCEPLDLFSINYSSCCLIKASPLLLRGRIEHIRPRPRG